MPSFYFVTPWYLVGLATLVVPFLLLLTKAQPRHVTTFSSVLFLRNITEKASRVIEWKRLLLLLVRIATLALLTFAFALPYLNKGENLFAGGAKQHLIFILDHSYGMEYRDGGQTLFERARQEILNRIEANKAVKTYFSFYRFDESLTPILIKTTDPKKISEALSQVIPTSYASEFTELAEGLPAILADSKSLQNEVLIYSDFSIPDAQTQERIQNLLKYKANFVHVIPVAIRPAEYRNFAIDDVVLPARFFLPGQEESIQVLYSSYGLKTGDEVTLDLWVDDIKTASATIKITKNKKGNLVFKHKFPTEGNYALRIESSEDNLMADNTRYVLAYVHAPLKFLFIEDKAFDYPFESPYFYVSQVLQSYNVESESQPWITVARTSIQNLSSIQISDYHFVFAADLSRFDTRLLTQLRYYLRDGGIVFFAPGANFEIKRQTENNYLTKFLGGHFGTAESSEKGREAFHLNSINYRHPLFQIFKEGKEGNLSRVSVYQFLPFFPEEESTFEVLAWFESKFPAFLLGHIDRGSLFIWTSSLNDAWNNFPKDPLYVPFVFELIKYAALKEWSTKSHLRVGDPLLEFGQGKAAFQQVVIKNPKGEQMNAYGDSNAISQSYRTDMPGFYEWILMGANETERKTLAFNVDSRESQNQYLPLQPEQHELPIEDQPTVLNGALSRESFIQRVFFYLPAFYIILGLLMLESWLANQFYKPNWV